MTDISIKEQITFSVRYVDMEKYVIKEDFLGFTELFSTTGISIKEVILKKLNDFGLSLANLRGQGYDGGSNMSGMFYYIKQRFPNCGSRRCGRICTLTETNIQEEDYEHAKTVWNHFGCKTLGEYSDLYLKIDVLLLADVFENYRDLCLTTYCLNPSFYYTAPGFSFDCMLKYTRVKLELLSEYDMLLMIEKGIRGELTQASMGYDKANNEKTPDYDPTKPKSWLIYQDCKYTYIYIYFNYFLILIYFFGNNLYGWAMSQYMPYGGFKWVEPKLEGLNDLNDTS
ncbi:Uncharacterized protein FWK35_00023908, partial [Aphis craccivora]